MKKIILFIAISFISIHFLQGQSGLAITFRAGQPANGTIIGIKLGPFLPYLGADYFTFGFNVDRKDDEFVTDWESGMLVHHWEYRDHTEVQTDVFMPTFGLRFYLMQSDIRAYLLAEVGPGLPDINIESTGYEHQYNPDGSLQWDESWDDHFKLKDDAEDLDFGRFSIGLGLEYDLETELMIGGEFGFQFVGGHMMDEGSESGDKPHGSYWEDKWKNEVGGGLGGTYTRFTLSFYF